MSDEPGSHVGQEENVFDANLIITKDQHDDDGMIQIFRIFSTCISFPFEKSGSGGPVFRWISNPGHVAVRQRATTRICSAAGVQFTCPIFSSPCEPSDA